MRMNPTFRPGIRERPGARVIAAPVTLAFLVTLVIVPGAASVGVSPSWTIGASNDPGWARAQFGAAVAIVGGDVLVSEPRRMTEPGAVYVYRRGGSGWSEAATIRPADRTGDGFGSAMAAQGNTLLVGAADQDAAGAAAYLYERDASGSWRQVARLAPADSAGPSLFGYSVALDGDVALVGAPLENGQKGAVHVFRRGPDGWQRAGHLTAGDAAERTFFGVVVALDGDRALIFSPQHGVYAFSEQDGEWRETGKLALEDVQGAGAVMRIDAGRAYVGAPAMNGGTGAVFLFDAGADGSWTPAGHIEPAAGDAGAAAAARQAFGAGIAVSGDWLWIGAPRTADRRGAVDAYTRGANGEWTLSHTIERTAADVNEGFGANLALDERILVSGMVEADYGAGKAVIYEGEPGGLELAATVFSEEATYDAVTGAEIRCAENDGKAGEFSCGDVDLLAFLPIHEIGGGRGVELNDVWGWTDPETGKEYVLVGRNNGTSFVDISDPVSPVYIGDLPLTEGARPNSWRDIKVYEDHAYIVADGAGEHGIQIIDLTKLREFAGEPITFTEDAHYDRIHSAHNIVINEESGFAYTVGNGMGGETCGGGLHMVDIREPKAPEFAGCFADTQTGNNRTGYTHDAQCVTYRGPDERYQDREICIGSNETHISIADVTDKASPKPISRASYPNVSYTHQGWFTEDHRYFFVNDEGDEISNLVARTRTLVWDLQDLDDPVLATEHLAMNAASDHNLYIQGNLMYQANYASGLRILDITDPTNPVEVGWFDTRPDGEDAPGFTGAWSNYPFFESGVIAVSSIEQGLFLVRKAPPTPRPVS